MKARLEIPEIPHRGVILIAETEEEKDILEIMWQRQGKVAFYSKKDSELIIEPTEEDY